MVNHPERVIRQVTSIFLLSNPVNSSCARIEHQVNGDPGNSGGNPAAGTRSGSWDPGPSRRPGHPPEGDDVRPASGHPGGGDADGQCSARGGDHRRAPQSRGALDFPWSAGHGGGGMVPGIPAGNGVARGRLPPRSRPGRAVGEGSRGPGAGRQDVPRKPGDPRPSWPRPRPHAVLAEVVLPVQPAPPGHRRPGRLEAGAQAAAGHLVLAVRRADRAGSGCPWAGRPGGPVRGRAHRAPRGAPGLVVPGPGGDRARRSAPPRARGHRRARLQPGAAGRR